MLTTDNTTNDKHVIEWNIRNFTTIHLGVLEGDRLVCLDSKAGNLFDTVWRLFIYPRGQPGYNPNHLACSLRRVDAFGPEKIPIEFEFSLVTFEGIKTFTKSLSKEFKRNSCFGFSDFVKLEEIFSRKELLHDDTLKFKCELRLLPPKKQTSLKTFLSRFPTKKISKSMYLHNFQERSKQNPNVLTINEASEKELLLNVSMNRGGTCEDKIQEEAVGDETFEDQIQEEAVGNETFVDQIQEEAVGNETFENQIQEEAVGDETSEGQSQEKAIGNKSDEFPESCLHMVIIKKKWDRPVHVSCWIKLLNKKYEIAIDREIGHLFTEIKEKEEWVLPYFIDTNTLGDECIDKGSLRLEFNFTICDDQPVFHSREDVTPLKLREERKENTLAKDLLDLYQTKKFSDVTLKVGEEKFQAHKSVLAARSPKFDEIFTNLVKEGAKCGNSIVQIGDIDKDTMERMLKFIYIDELEQLDDEKTLLTYIAAQKYQISSLRFKCIRIFRNNLTLQTVYKILVATEEFKDSELKLVAQDHILKHYDYVVLTPEWQTFTEGHKELSGEVVNYLQIKKQEESEEWNSKPGKRSQTVA